MSRTEFTDNQTTVDAEWLNKIDASVVDGIGEKKTPTDVRNFIGAEIAGASGVVQGNLDSHVADTGIHYQDAPSDGLTYARLNNTWTEVASGGGSTTDHSLLLNLTLPDQHPIGTITGLQTKLDSHDAHIANTSNPHGVTAAQAGADPSGSAQSVQTNLDSHESNTDIHGYTTYVTPNDFGAVGDGVTDDTAALQAMAAAVIDEDFEHGIIVSDAQRGLGGVPAIMLDGAATYLISDTIVFATHVKVYGMGAGFIAAPGMVGKAMLRWKYRVNGPITTPIGNQYGTCFASIRDIILDGAGYAKYGIVIERMNWARYDSITITGCVQDGGTGGYAMRLEECQYSTFTNLVCTNNYSALLLCDAENGTPENLALKCIDNYFQGCCLHRNDNHAIHIGAGTNNVFNRMDIGRCGGTPVLIDNDNQDGQQTTSANRGNTFMSCKAEYTADDEPSGGTLFDVAVSNGYNTRILNLNLSLQNGTVNPRQAYTKMLRSAAQQCSVIDPVIQSNSSTLPENPDSPGDISLFHTLISDGIRAHFTTWTPLQEDVGKLCVDGYTGTAPNLVPEYPSEGSTRFNLLVEGNYRYYSQAEYSIP